MFLQQISTGDMVEVLGLDDLINPNRPALVGRYTAGEELQEPELYPKADLRFPSGEPLPRCWIDVHYREAALR